MDRLHAVAKALMDKETLEAEEFAQLVKSLTIRINGTSRKCIPGSEILRLLISLSA